jgi:hypothetical protein
MRYPQLPPKAAGKNQTKKQKTRWSVLRQRAEECFVLRTLCTPHRTRLAAGMMVMPMGAKIHAKIERKENQPCCQSEDLKSRRSFAAFRSPPLLF